MKKRILALILTINIISAMFLDSGIESYAAEGDYYQIKDLPVGSVVYDPMSTWQHRTSYNYIGTGATKPVKWYIAGKNNYMSNSVTLLATELIGLYQFDIRDNHTSTGNDEGYSDWGGSMQIRTWLNGTFYNHFNQGFKDAIITTTVPNVYGDGIPDKTRGESYNTSDKVFIPSLTEFGFSGLQILAVGAPYAYVGNNAQYPQKRELAGTDYNYWTRTPDKTSSLRCHIVHSTGSENERDTDHTDTGVLPVITIKNTTYVKQMASGEYELIWNSIPTINVTTASNQSVENSISLTGTVSDVDTGNIITVKYNIDGGETRTVVGTVVTSGIFTTTSINTTALAKGIHTIKVWAVDNMGFTSDIKTINFNKIITISTLLQSIFVTSTDKTVEANVICANDISWLSTKPFVYIIDGQESQRTDKPQFTFNNLVPNTKYNIEVRVLDELGNTTIHTEEIYTKAQVPTVSISTVLDDQLQLNLTDDNPVGTLYLIMCNNQYINAIGQISTIPVWMTLSEKSLILENLDYNKTYEFNIKARNKTGQESAYSETITVMLEVESIIDYDSQNNTSIKVISKTGKQVQLGWDAPIDPAQIIKYEIYRDGQLVKTTQNTVFTDHNLDYATDYIYEIKAYDTSQNVSYLSEPLRVVTSDIEEISKIAAGEMHNLMLKSDGTVWAWGGNQYGQLGDGTTDDSDTAKKVKGLENIINVFAGSDFSFALKSDGTVWAWGANAYGQLGNDTLEVQLEPIQIKNLYDVISISAGDTHSMFLTSDGSVWGSGSNEFGQLGDDSYSLSKIPVKILGIKDVKDISAGGYHTLALKHDGTVWSWGANWTGQLGNSTTIDNYTPVQIPNLDGIVKVSGGQNHTLALKEDGTVWSWGSNENGEIGDGATTNRLEPVQVIGLENVINIDVGSYHNVILKNDKTVWTWGANWYGALGHGAWSDSSIPVQTIGLSNVEQIIAGAWHNIVITTDQNLWSWGKGDHGQLGNGNLLNTNIPEILEGFVQQTVTDSLTEVATDTTIMISWSGGADTGAYEIELNNDIITSVERNYCLVTGLEPNTTYTYRIRQIYLMDTTEWSEPRSITTYALPTPNTYEGNIDETSIEIKWDELENATSYEVEVDGEVMDIGTETVYNHMDLEQNTSHVYRVRAIGADGTSSWSEEIPVTTLPIRPESPNDLKGFVTDSVVKLEWTAVEGVIGYDIELDGILIENGTETTYEHTDLNPYSEHQYRIRSRNELIEGIWSDFLTVITIGKPKAPEKIAVTTVGQVSTITWEPKLGLRYEIEVDGIIYNTGNHSNYIHRGITLGEEHLYRIRSTNDLGTSDWSGYVVNNSIKAISTRNEDLELGLTASNITDFSQYELSVFYNKDVLKVKDLCAKTSALELIPGFIEQEGITIKSFEPGKITFTVTKDIELGYDWTGIVNNIIFDGQISGGTTIDYTVYIIPELER